MAVGECSCTVSWVFREAQRLWLLIVRRMAAVHNLNVFIDLLALVMKSRGMDAAGAIKFIKTGEDYVLLLEKRSVNDILTRRHSIVRPQAHPNYGFITQLVTFAACGYAPGPNDPTYRTWKRQQKQNMTAYLNYLSDSTIILPDKLLLSRSVTVILALNLTN
jgi:hypothetical protein